MQININKESVNAVLVGRILAGIIFVIALMESSYFASQAGSSNFWVFLGSVVTPLAVSFLIIMVTEVLRVMQARE